MCQNPEPVATNQKLKVVEEYADESRNASDVYMTGWQPVVLTNAKGFGFPKPFLIEILLLYLSFDDLEARIGIQLDLVRRDRSVAFEVAQTDSG